MTIWTSFAASHKEAVVLRRHPPHPSCSPIQSRYRIISISKDGTPVSTYIYFTVSNYRTD